MNAPPGMYGHHTAHARGNLVPLVDDDVCRWLWNHLREGFPEALAAILMPDHLHLIAPWLEGARRRLAAILGACAAFFGLGEVWAPVPVPEPLRTGDEVARGVRYSGLNCSRPWKHRGRPIRLVPDPLMWRWSTLRDCVGAIADPWVPIARIGEALRRPAEGLAQRFHRYVSSDPHVSPTGTRFPVAAVTSVVPRVTLESIATAAVECVRLAPEALRRRSPARRIFAALAVDQGWSQPASIARVCDVHPNSVPRLVRSCPPRWLEAARLCLGDERLTAGICLPF